MCPSVRCRPSHRRRRASSILLRWRVGVAQRDELWRGATLTRRRRCCERRRVRRRATQVEDLGPAHPPAAVTSTPAATFASMGGKIQQRRGEPKEERGRGVPPCEEKEVRQVMFRVGLLRGIVARWDFSCLLELCGPRQMFRAVGGLQIFPRSNTEKNTKPTQSQ